MFNKPEALYLRAAATETEDMSCECLFENTYGWKSNLQTLLESHGMLLALWSLILSLVPL